MVEAGDYVDGSNVAVGRLVGTLLGGGVVAVGAGTISFYERVVHGQIRAIEGLTGFSAEFIRSTLGEAAALHVTAWGVAAADAIQYGPAAPWIVAAEVLALTTLALAIWNRRPYA